MDEMKLIESMLTMGAHKAGIVACSEIPFNPIFRQACEANYCGMYGRCWMCPPHVGEIDQLIAEAKGYSTAVVYQTIAPLEDSFDIEGMLEAGQKHNDLAQAITSYLRERLPQGGWLHLGAGGCRFCEKCAKQEEQPCRFPDHALASLEAYGVAVSELAPLAGMQYINGQNTVTYFGAVFLTESAALVESGKS